MIISAINLTDKIHLAEVIEEMKALGAPVIRVYDNGDEIVALEGSHRLAAAAALDPTPVIVRVNEADEMETDLDIYDDETGRPYGCRPVPVSVIVDYILQSRGFSAPVYEF